MLNGEERIGTVLRDYEIVPFRRCVSKCGLDDIKSTGCFYAWNNKQGGEHRVYCKIDRALCNER